MEDLSLKKFDRVVAILTNLQSKKTVKAQELADKFNVSLRTIYRDIKTLEASGVPIIGEAGIGYTVVEGYRLPPIMFTKQEASSFVTAEKLMASFTDKNLKESFQSGIGKIKAVLKNTDKDWLETLDSQITIYNQNKLFNDTIPHVFEAVLESIASKKQINLTYKSFDDEHTHRIIEPVGVFNEHSYWYIFGYCLLRKDYRQFRTDRILGLSLSDISFTKEHGKIEDYRRKDSNIGKKVITLLFEKKVARYTKGTRKYYGFVSEEEKENGIEMVFRANEQHDEYLVRWFLMFGDQATVISPVEFKDKVSNMIQKISERL